MSGLYKVSLQDLLSEYGEGEVKSFLSSFLCPLNADVEHFLRVKAIEFEKQSLSKTQIVLASFKKAPVLCGYYTISTKAFNISRSAMSKSKQKVLRKFATYDSELKSYVLPAPLIAQLGKNYASGYNKLITGDDLLKMACDDILLVQAIVGGKIVYLECEDKEELLSFYRRNGFVEFNKRQLDKDETNINGKYLIQMLRIMRRDE